MTARAKAQETTIAEAAELRLATENVCLASMRTELDVVRTTCLLAEQEDGEKRTRHIQLAERALKSVLEIVKRVAPNQQDRRDIEEALHSIHQLGGRDFS